MMSLRQVCYDYYRLGRTTNRYMDVKKWDFTTEILLSIFILVIHIESQNPNPTIAMGAIAIIHSFNVGHAFEAYKKAKLQQSHAQDAD